ncbi:MAG: DUF4258 domain-containing protein [Candidatus Hydrogenedentes bacterium]|nr:DUF4258 domain-containing protein [Candidatus Hydrogenedentota bacterium]
MQRAEYIITKHAEAERQNEDIGIDELERVLKSGTIIEDYPDDPRGPSCLNLGMVSGRPLHVVCGRNRHDYLVRITAYIPRLPKWRTPTERNRP